MGYVFNPPTQAEVPPFLPDTEGQAIRLFRHMKARARGLNIFLLSDGTYVTNHGAVPYPWNPDDPSGPYSSSLIFGQAEVTASLKVWVVKVYWGGHATPITDAEQASLTAAGYGSYITGTP